MDVRARDDIAELVHRYADAVTTRDVYRWTECWADDATWTLRPGRPVFARADIVALVLSAPSTPGGVVQNVLNGEVRVDGDQASGRWHIQEHLRPVTGEPVLSLAH